MKNARLFLFASLLALSGCSTFEGLKTDLSKGFGSISQSFDSATDPDEAKKNLPVYDGVCPPVTVRPDLKHLSEFYDTSKPSPATKTSEVDIVDVQNTCRVENGALVMQIDLSLTGKTGPKARMQPNDQPSFAYPYFVAVTDEQGNVLSKEIFAASLAYGHQDAVTQTESIFQNMPFADKAAGQSYNVIVGFQLTEDQLAYNQATANGTNVPVAAPTKSSKINSKSGRTGPSTGTVKAPSNL